MLHSKHDKKHRVRRTDARQDRPTPLGRRYALLLGLLALSLLTVIWLDGAHVAWATSPVSPVTGIPSGDGVPGSVFWDRVRTAFSWRSPLPWFLIGLPGLGLLSWGLLWGLSRLEAANNKRSETQSEERPGKDQEILEE